MASSRSRVAARAYELIGVYTRDVSRVDVERLFTRDARDACRFFTATQNDIDFSALPFPKRILVRARAFFVAFNLRLSPVRRLIYGIALVFALLGLLQLFRGFALRTAPSGLLSIPLLVPVWQPGTLFLLAAFLLVNLLVVLELADRLSLKNDLDIAREIQQAMLPRGTTRAPGVEVHGATQPANTVGGDFYDVQQLANGRLMIALGDVAGKGSPAALLMALLLAMLRTLLDEALDPPELMARLNRQILRHAPSTRFITLFLGFYDPASGALSYVNAGHTPPLVARQDGSFEPLTSGGVALGMFEGSTYVTGRTTVTSNEMVVVYSDGITEAEHPVRGFFDQQGLERVLASAPGSASDVCDAVVRAAIAHTAESKLSDDLTVLVLKRLARAT